MFRNKKKAKVVSRHYVKYETTKLGDLSASIVYYQQINLPSLGLIKTGH